jgi:hypothetical protein
MERHVLRRGARPQRHLSLAENTARGSTLQQLERIRSSPLVPIHGMCSRQIALSGGQTNLQRRHSVPRTRRSAQRCAAEPGSIVPLALRWVPALRSSVKNAAPRPGHERNLLPLPCGDLPVGRLVDGCVESLLQKYFCFHTPQITSRTLRIPSHTEGRFAIVTDVGTGCGGRGSVLRAMGSQGG